MAIDQDVEELLIMGDLDLIILQSQGEWETWDVKLIPYKQHVEDLSKRFKLVEFSWKSKSEKGMVTAIRLRQNQMFVHVGATPYLLVYGTEAVIPAEVEIPSLGIIVEVKIEDSEWVKTV
uniref:Uncharacterized protein LOC104239935 n=1 Tax=Nicotiana sylvestris TaxID=4096 RepID=A0A1U7XQ40_NICSY|nr:PREDICTED: uncharacterized protein LOC104239935 [Nicotiana sylvestris]